MPIATRLKVDGPQQKKKKTASRELYLYFNGHRKTFHEFFVSVLKSKKGWQKENKTHRKPNKRKLRTGRRQHFCVRTSAIHLQSTKSTYFRIQKSLNAIIELRFQ